MIEQRLPDTDTQAGYDVVVHEASFRNLRQRALVVAVGAVAAGGLAVSALQAVGGSDVSPAPSRPAQVTGQVEDRPVRLEGTWRSVPVTADQLVDRLRTIGHGYRSGRLRYALPDGLHRLTLTFDHGSAALTMGGVVVDRQTYTVNDDVLVFTGVRAYPGRTTYTFDVERNTLTFTFFGTTEHPTRGVPGMQYQLALYTSVPFEHVGQ